MLLDSYIQRRILLTLSYSAQFNYPLTIEELWQRLITDTDIPFKAVNTITERLVAKKIITKKQRYYYLTAVPLDISIRQTREVISKNKFREAERFVEIARKIPWIQAIAVTGSLAVNNAKEDDDIDFLIVTTKHSLWISRLLVICIALFRHKRRSWGGEEKNSWCFNMWLEEDQLGMPRRLHTLYGGYEICQTRWIYDRNKIVSGAYYKLNRWVLRYLKHFYHEVHSEVGKSAFHVKSVNLFTAFINYSAYLLQRIYMVPHLTKEKVSLSYAFFHPRDTKMLIYDTWQKIVEKI